jgi:hypothetical protein
MIPGILIQGARCKMPKQFTVREVRSVVNKLAIDKPIGYMDRRWNLALDTLVDKLQRLSDAADRAENGEPTNVTPIKPVDAPKPERPKLP